MSGAAGRFFAAAAPGYRWPPAGLSAIGAGRWFLPLEKDAVPSLSPVGVDGAAVGRKSRRSPLAFHSAELRVSPRNVKKRPCGSFQ